MEPSIEGIVQAEYITERPRYGILAIALLVVFLLAFYNIS
jgi:hypothetical protein